MSTGDFRRYRRVFLSFDESFVNLPFGRKHVFEFDVDSKPTVRAVVDSIQAKFKIILPLQLSVSGFVIFPDDQSRVLKDGDHLDVGVKPSLPARDLPPPSVPNPSPLQPKQSSKRRKKKRPFAATKSDGIAVNKNPLIFTSLTSKGMIQIDTVVGHDEDDRPRIKRQRLEAPRELIEILHERKELDPPRPQQPPQAVRQSPPAKPSQPKPTPQKKNTTEKPESSDEDESDDGSSSGDDSDDSNSSSSESSSDDGDTIVAETEPQKTRPPSDDPVIDPEQRSSHDDTDRTDEKNDELPPRSPETKDGEESIIVDGDGDIQMTDASSMSVKGEQDSREPLLLLLKQKRESLAKEAQERVNDHPVPVVVSNSIMLAKVEPSIAVTDGHISAGDRIRLKLPNGWTCGIVRAIIDANRKQFSWESDRDSAVRLRNEADGEFMEHVHHAVYSLNEIEWEFEPENFVAPRNLPRDNGNVVEEKEQADTPGGPSEGVPSNAKPVTKGQLVPIGVELWYREVDLSNRWEPVLKNFEKGVVLRVKEQKLGIFVLQVGDREQDVNIWDAYEAFYVPLTTQQKRKLRRQRQKKRRKSLEKPTAVVTE